MYTIVFHRKSCETNMGDVQKMNCPNNVSISTSKTQVLIPLGWFTLISFISVVVVVVALLIFLAWSCEFNWGDTNYRVWREQTGTCTMHSFLFQSVTFHVNLTSRFQVCICYQLFPSSPSLNLSTSLPQNQKPLRGLLWCKRSWSSYIDLGDYFWSIRELKILLRIRLPLMW